MQEMIEEIRKQAEERIKEIHNSQELQELKVKVLGKKSELSNLLKGLGNLSPEERQTALDNMIILALESIISK